MLSLWRLNCAIDRIFILSSQTLRCGWSALGTEEVDPLFWRRHSDHLLCGHEWIRPGFARGRDHQSDARVVEAVWLYLQQQVVHRHQHNPLPKQEGFVCGEDQTFASHCLFSRVSWWVGRPSCLPQGFTARPFLTSPFFVNKTLAYRHALPTALNVGGLNDLRVSSADYAQ